MRMMLKLPGAQSDQPHWQAHPGILTGTGAHPGDPTVPAGHDCAGRARTQAGAACHPMLCRMALDHPSDHPDDPSGSVGSRPGRRAIQHEQAGSDPSRALPTPRRRSDSEVSASATTSREGRGPSSATTCLVGRLPEAARPAVTSSVCGNGHTARPVSGPRGPVTSVFKLCFPGSAPFVGVCDPGTLGATARHKPQWSARVAVVAAVGRTPESGRSSSKAALPDR